MEQTALTLRERMCRSSQQMRPPGNPGGLVRKQGNSHDPVTAGSLHQQAFERAVKNMRCSSVDRTRTGLIWSGAVLSSNILRSR